MVSNTAGLLQDPSSFGHTLFCKAAQQSSHLHHPLPPSLQEANEMTQHDPSATHPVEVINPYTVLRYKYHVKLRSVQSVQSWESLL